MRIERFWARNYRSLADVEITFDGDIDVFYGANGAGKSNIFRGMEVVFRAMREARPRLSTPRSDLPGGEWLTSEDRYRGAAHGQAVVLGIEISAVEGVKVPANGRLPGFQVDRVKVEFQWLADVGGFFHQFFVEGAHSVDLARADRLSKADELQYLAEAYGLNPVDVAHSDAGQAFSWQVDLLLEILRQARPFALVSDVRRVAATEDLSPQPTLPGLGVTVPELLREGRLAEALFAAKNSGDPDLNSRWLDFQRFMEDGLKRPMLDVVTQHDARGLRLVERVGRDFHPIDLAGLGIQQLYIMFAQVFLSGARCVAIEEPEAHLHMPDTGLTVRRLLRKALRDGEIDQLLLATHDSAFAMDSESFLEVSFDPSAGTQVRRDADLLGIDRHVYEPGPVIRALQTLMHSLDPSEVVFRRTDGGDPVTAESMLQLIQDADPVAQEYMEQYQQFVVHLTRARARQNAPTTVD